MNCSSQLNLNSINCTNDAMCQNSQGCYNGTCTNWFSLALNTNVLVGKTSQSPNFLCKSGVVNKDGLCYGLISYASNLTVEKNGLVICNMTATLPCNYIDSLKQPIAESCQCSLDKSGSSFCRNIYNGKLIIKE